MNYLGKVFNNWKYFYGEINAATLTGAIDVVIVEQPDGSYTCSPFHVRFGKMGVLRSKEKIVDIEINGEPVDIHMKLGESGEAFFVEEVEEENVPPHLACSPIPPDSGEETADVNKLDDEDRGGGGEEGGRPPEQGGAAFPSLAVSSTPKTFRAEKVEEETVLETTEFRPITGQNSSTSLSGLDTDFAKDDSPSADEKQSVASISNSSNSSKRKRRKKSTKKKNKDLQKKRNSVGGSQALDESGSEVIFQLDDIDSPTSPTATTSEVSPHDQLQEKIDVTKPLDLSGVTHEGHDIHFFSDTEITPGSSPRDGCDFGPIQSDSEFETKRLVESEERHGAEETSQSQWKWGELPTSASIEDNKQESQKWMLQSMLGFMKKTKHMRHKTESDGGIYLSDLNSEDPEMAALYFPTPHRQSAPSLRTMADYQESREEDAESGNGPSLPQSPHSVEGAICGPKLSEVDFDSTKCYPDDLALSICGPNPTQDQFDEGLVTYSEFVDNPHILSNPKLVVRFGGKHYTWKSAAPILVSVLFFQKSLPQETLSRITESGIEVEDLHPGSDKGKESKKSYSWWWSRNNPNATKDGAPLKEGEDLKPADLTEDIDGVAKPEAVKRPDTISSEIPVVDQPLDLSPQNRVENLTPPPDEPLKDEGVGTPDFSSDKYRKTLRLTSAQIAGLNLRSGANEIQFSVTTAYQGTSKCKCFLFCWRYDDKIVVSDIDGTITKSDVLGHILPIVGKDWAQSGVAKLFTKIKDNGYKLLYLSARAIGQSRVTREYLKSIKQEDLGLPEGPMLLNPTSLLTAFHTEVIERKPEEFKISCLRDIQALFPSHLKPFYAGYGNKINDVWAYQAVGIPIFRIFTINHRGELKHELTQTFQSSYTNMSHLVDQMFPPNKPFSSEDFSQFVFWREPILDIEEELSSQVKS